MTSKKIAHLPRNRTTIASGPVRRPDPFVHLLGKRRYKAVAAGPPHEYSAGTLLVHEPETYANCVFRLMSITRFGDGDQAFRLMSITR